MNYRPLSARGKTGTTFDALHEGLPSWLLEPVRSWLRPFVRTFPDHGGVHYYTEWLRNLQARMHLEPPLPWGHKMEVVAEVFEGRVESDGGELGLDIVDYALHHLHETHASYKREEAAQEMNSILRAGGSAWEVTPVGDDGSCALTRRAVGPVAETIDAIRPVSERAGAHLMEAWRHLAGRDPLPDQAYFQALLAVESAAKPVISPNDGDATLGKMLRAVRDAPQKFVFVLGDPEAVLPVMEAMWSTHRRHGTDDREAPMGMSQAEADAALHLAISLVRWFVGGGFKQAV